MLIQKLLMPTEENCPVDEARDLYFRREGEELSLFTYFNSFSIGKWRSYTGLTNLSLRMKIRGQAKMKAFVSVGSVDDSIKDAWNDELLLGALHETSREISVDATENGDEVILHFPELPIDGVLYVVCSNCSRDFEILSGGYETEDAPRREIKLALGICTYQREEYLKRNVDKLLRDIIRNDKSPLYGRVEIFISDNGKTLPVNVFEDELVHIYPNMNAGGAGGFTRTMIEALLRGEGDFTHMILMDDDILLLPDVIERTYHFLQYVSEAYQNSMLGAHMFCMEESKRYRQFEAGAKWIGTEVEFYGKMWDMRYKEAVSANNLPNPLNYSGWWYSVIPTTIIRADNLPLPLFIHYDDMEYGVRNEANGTILLNGIAVWHPQGVNKAPVRMIYYDIRNMMICMSGLHRATASQVITMLRNRVIGAVIRYRYEEAEVCFEAIEDFYRGPDWFMKLDPLEKHADLVKFNYKYEDPEVYGIDLSKTKNKVYRGLGGKLIFLWGLLLWLLPSVRPLKIAGLEDIGLPFSAKRVFHYDADKGQGYMTEKSYGRAWKDFVRYCRICRMIRRRHETMMDAYEAKKAEYSSLAFWENYLGIED